MIYGRWIRVGLVKQSPTSNFRSEIRNHWWDFASLVPPYFYKRGQGLEIRDKGLERIRIAVFQSPPPKLQSLTPDRSAYKIIFAGVAVRLPPQRVVACPKGARFNVLDSVRAWRQRTVLLIRLIVSTRSFRWAAL
jgi:hypothetical protein